MKPNGWIIYWNFLMNYGDMLDHFSWDVKEMPSGKQY